MKIVSRDYTNRLNFNNAIKRLNKSDIFYLTVFLKKTLTECESVVVTIVIKIVYLIIINYINYVFSVIKENSL